MPKIKTIINSFANLKLVKKEDLSVFKTPIQDKEKGKLQVAIGVEGDYSGNYSLKPDNPHEKMYHNCLLFSR